jgi:hypothetical protein
VTVLDAMHEARGLKLIPHLHGLADEDDLRLRFVLTKTKQPELHRYWTARDRAAHVRLYRLAAEILAAIEAGVFPPRIGWHWTDLTVG